ncbi:MAG: hypothetical protein ACYTDT_02610, partial [Planctomycetota bacterium]
PNKHKSPKADRAKRFEVKVSIDVSAFKVDLAKYEGEGTSPSGSPAPRVEMPKDPPKDPNVEKVDSRPPTSKLNKDGSWDIGTEDYVNIDIDALTQELVVVSDKDGKPIGIQISKDAKDESVLLRRGGRRGDVIKTINGKKIVSMSDARRIVRTDYNNGIEKFEVVYERDGIPGRKTFNVPRKKKEVPTDG